MSVMTDLWGPGEPCGDVAAANPMRIFLKYIKVLRGEGSNRGCAGLAPLGATHRDGDGRTFGACAASPAGLLLCQLLAIKRYSCG